jgi:hypothetical protein
VDVTPTAVTTVLVGIVAGGVELRRLHADMIKAIVTRIGYTTLRDIMGFLSTVCEATKY